MSGLVARIGVQRSQFELDVSIEIEPGETVVLLGPNGAGKSTTLEAIAGSQPLHSGVISLNEGVLDDPAADTFVPAQKRRIGVMFQDYLLFPHMTALDNITFGPMSAGSSRAVAREAAWPWIDSLDLTAVADRRPAELSGGQAQRVALARALATNPDLLLLDEPLGALDVSTHMATRRLLRDHLSAVHSPRLVITHDAADAFMLADRIVVLENGHVTQSGTPEEIRRRPQSRYAADLVGINLIQGVVDGGAIAVDDGGFTLMTSNRSASGPVLVTIHPRAVALHRDKPHGSPRNTWQATIESIEPLGETTRVQLGLPLNLTADVTPGAVEDLSLTPGADVWVAIKATEIAVSGV